MMTAMIKNKLSGIVAIAAETAIKSSAGQARDTPEKANLIIDAYYSRVITHDLRRQSVPRLWRAADLRKREYFVQEIHFSLDHEFSLAQIPPRGI